jgi:hypothetical protein
MIRGSIEVAQKTRVAGWIYSSADTVRDKLILAFVNGRCVGSGKVDKFRKDLLEAKLGDGYCGYDFPIKLNDDENLGGVIVKLQNSDAALIQKTTRLTGPDDDEGNDLPDLGALSPASVTWMQDRGWLEQHEYDFIKALHNIGAYERGLRPTRRGMAEGAAQQKPDVVVQELLGMYTLGDVAVQRHQIPSVSDLGRDKSPLRNARVSAVALWSEERGRLSLDERSHTAARHERARVLAEPVPGSIEYSFGPDRLLFLHRDCSFAPLGTAPASGIILFTAIPRSEMLVENPNKRERAA